MKSAADIINPCFFAHAERKTVACKVFEAMRDDEMPLNSLVSLVSDRPNVNKTIFRELSKCIKEECPEWNGLANIDTCNLQTMHTTKVLISMDKRLKILL